MATIDSTDTVERWAKQGVRGGGQTPAEQFHARVGAKLTEKYAAMPGPTGIVPVPPQAPPVNTTMGNAFAEARNLRTGIQETPLPPKAAAAPNFGIAEGPYKSNVINYNTRPAITAIDATTAPGATAPTAPKPDIRAAGWQPQNPRFADGNPISNRGTMAMAAIEERRSAQQALTAQQSAARQAAYAQDAAARAATEADAARVGLNKASPVGAPPAPTPTPAALPAATPVAAPGEPTRVQKGLAWVDDALTGLGKTKAGSLVMQAANSPVGKFVGKLGGIGAQFGYHHGEAGAPTLDAERVAAMSRPWDPAWKPSGLPQAQQPPKLSVAGDATMPGQDPGRPGLRQADEAPPPPPRTEFLARGSAGFNAANKQMDSGAAYTPGDGQGMLRSSSGITRFNTPQTQGQPASQDFLRRQYESAPRALPPSLASNAGAPGAEPQSFTQELIGLRRQGQANVREHDMAKAQMVQGTAAAANQTALRGQDMDYERAMVPAVLAAQLRQRSADIYKAANGDQSVAARLAQAAGMDPTPFLTARKSELDNVKATEEVDVAKVNRGKGLFDDKFITYKEDGTQVDNKWAKGHAEQLMTAASEAFRQKHGRDLTATEMKQNSNDIIAKTKAIAGFRLRDVDHNNSWPVALGLQDNRSPTTDIPDSAVDPEEVGWWEGLRKGGKVQAGDVRFGGKFLPGDTDADAKDYLLRTAEYRRAQKGTK